MSLTPEVVIVSLSGGVIGGGAVLAAAVAIMKHKQKQMQQEMADALGGGLAEMMEDE